MLPVRRLATTGLVALTCLAPLPAQVRPADSGADPWGEQAEDAVPDDQLGVRAVPAIVKASSILGARVYDAFDVSVGAVEDLVVDEQGRIVALLLSADAPEYELSAGQLLAVPPGSVELRAYELAEKGPAGRADAYTLDRGLDAMAAAPRVDRLEAVDPTRMAVVYAYFSVPAEWNASGADRAVGGSAGDGAIDGDRPRPERERASGRGAVRPRWSLAGDVLGAAVADPAGRRLGTLGDLAVSSAQDRLVYAVLASGGTAGPGEKHFAVPWTALGKTRDGFRLDVDLERLRRADGFEHWPSRADDELFARAPATAPQDEGF